MPADGAPAWLLGWQAQHPQPEPEFSLAPPPASPPVEYRHKQLLRGIIKPKPWKYDHSKRREAVIDNDQHPPRVIRNEGWHRCLKCRRPFWSDDVVRLRQCNDCKVCEDRYT